MIDKGAITTHYIAHWGVPSDIRPRTLKGLGDFAILEFRPRGARASWRYATNGMSNFSQPYPGPNREVRTELYACTQHKVDWIDELLAALAIYPIEHKTYFAQWETVSTDEPLDRRNSPYRAVMLVPPGLSDPPTLGLIGGIPETILVHQLIGLFPAELEYTKSQTGKKLWDRIVKEGEQLLDAPRMSVL